MREPIGPTARRLVARYVPITTWLPAYDRAWLPRDLLGGVTSWAVMVPVALAYATLAGVPPEFGLVTAFAALAAYAVFGTSRHLKVTTSSTMAIMSASVVANLAGGDPERYIALTAGLALVVGVILIVAGLVRLGFIADFLSKSVITGFIFGLAITIIVGQLPKILGVPSGGDGTLEKLANVVSQIPNANLYAVALGLGALAIILGLRAISRRIPGPLIALVLGIAAVVAFDLTRRASRSSGPSRRSRRGPAFRTSRSSTSRSSRRARRASSSSPSASRSARRGRSRSATGTRSARTRSSSGSGPRTSPPGCSAGSPWTRASRSRPRPRRPA